MVKSRKKMADSTIPQPLADALRATHMHNLKNLADRLVVKDNLSTDEHEALRAAVAALRTESTTMEPYTK